MAASSDLGSVLRLRRLQPSELPTHPDLASLQRDSTLDARTFATNALREAETFCTSYLPAHFTVKSTSKSSPPAKALVKLLTHEILTSSFPDPIKGTGQDEAWFARSSVHDNRAEPGTADWSELERYLLDDHSQHEKDYTPDVYAAHQVLAWDAAELQGIEGWEKVEMAIYEMCHTLPPPLHNRVFAVLVVKARSTGSSSFITAQIPVDLSKVPQALFSNGRNKTDGQPGLERKETTAGIYVSVERAELVAQGAQVEWLMGTASDAKGVLPMWAQKMGVPGAVVKDVGLVMDFVDKQRRKTSA